MAIDRPNARFIGNAKDQEGFACQVLECTETGAQFLSYEPEVYWERERYLTHLKSMGKRNNTPKGSWPARPPRKE